MMAQAVRPLSRVREGAVELRAYQDSLAGQAVDILRRLGLVYLSMQVRTGKTITALETARRYGARKVLFVTRLKAIPSIQADYDALGPGYEMDVINYEALRKVEGKYDLVVLDEAHCLGAFPKPSQRTKWCKHHCQGVPLILLSGTPTPESYSQIFHQLWVSDRSPFAKYKNFYQWSKDFVDRTTRHLNGFSIADYSRARKGLIEPLIKPYMLSLSQEEAGFTCPVQEHFIEVVDPNIPGLIKELFDRRVIRGKTGEIVADSPAKLMSKAHQLSGGTVILESGEAVVVSRAKAEAIKARFTGKRIAIFYKFVKEREVLAEVYGDALTDSPEEFQKNPRKVFCSQILSGREGIALHAADAIVFYSIDYSATSYWQARARLQTLNRSKPADIYWVFFQGGIERKVYAAVSDKKDFTLSYFYATGGTRAL